MVQSRIRSSLVPFTAQKFQQLHVLGSEFWFRGYEQTIELDRTKLIHAHLTKTHSSSTTSLHHNFNPSAQFNFLVTSYIKNGHPGTAIKIYVYLRRNDFRPDGFTMPSVLKACAQVRCARVGEEMHGFAVKSGLDEDVFLLNALISMYGECGKLYSAGFLFDEMPKRDAVSWSTMIRSHFRNGLLCEAVKLVRDMCSSGLRPSDVVMITMGNLFASLGNSGLAKATHACVIRNSSDEEMMRVPLTTALIDMHAKCKNLPIARRLFDGLIEKNIVSWTSMISGCIRGRELKEAAELFSRMQGEGIVPNEVTLLSLVSECGFLGALQLGKQIHGYILRHGFVITSALISALIDMYGKSGDVKYAKALFHRSIGREILMWNVMISAYSRARCIDEACNSFVQMKAAGLKPNEASFLSLLPTCAGTGALILGRWVHSCLMKLGMADDLMLKTALLDTYAKCGKIEDASRLFDEARIRDICMWNTMIGGYGKHGRGNEALLLYREMEEQGTKPNGTTFIAILHACSHCGMVEEGKKVFHEMVHGLGLIPKVEHYGCMVDLLGRAGLLEEALELIHTMPWRPNVTVWGALLAASRLHRNSKLEELASKQILEIEPRSSSYSALMSNFHAAMDRWDCVEEVRQRM
ncbi:hypothetical protein CRG98_047461, partial [Punica granatum]